MNESFKKLKNSKIMRKKKRSLVREQIYGKPSFLSLKKKDRSDLRIN